MMHSDKLPIDFAQQEKPNTVFAHYTSTSIFHVNIDLDSVSDWYVKWDILHIKFADADPEYTKFYPTHSAVDCTDYKYPDSEDSGYRDDEFISFSNRIA